MPECESCEDMVEDLHHSADMSQDLCTSCYGSITGCVECNRIFIREGGYFICDSCQQLFDWDRIHNDQNEGRLERYDFNHYRDVRRQYRRSKERKKMIIGKRVVYEPVERNTL